MGDQRSTGIKAPPTDPLILDDNAVTVFRNPMELDARIVRASLRKPRTFRGRQNPFAFPDAVRLLTILVP